MPSTNEIGIVIPVRDELAAFNNGLLANILNAVPEPVRPTLFFVVNNSGAEFIDFMDGLRRREPNVDVIQLGHLVEQTFAIAYLLGLERSIGDGFQVSVEMDGNGAHDPRYLESILKPFDDGADVVFSTRFGFKSGIEGYPFQRRLVSRIGTIIFKILYHRGYHLSDLTGGYEAFRREVLEQIFAHFPPDDWISVVDGPGHFYQVEMKYHVLQNRNIDVREVPILWGSHRAKPPNKLSTSTIVRAVRSAIELRNRNSKTIYQRPQE